MVPIGCLHMRFRTCFPLALLVASASCAPSEPQNRRSEVFTEHRFLKAQPNAPKKQLGEDCSTNGASECQSELCFHTDADPSKGHVCSKACGSDEDCPEAWACRSVYPSPGSSFCVPPEHRAASALASRPTSHKR